MNRDQLGKFIREKRTELKLSQSQLAEKANISYRRVLDIEKNNRNASFDVVNELLGSMGYDLTITPREPLIIAGMKWNLKYIRPAEDPDIEKAFKKQLQIK